MPCQKIKSIELANIYEAYSITNKMKFNTTNDAQKHMLLKQFVAWYCEVYSTAPVSAYINYPIFQKLPLKTDCFNYESDERVYIYIRDRLGCTNKIEKPSKKDSKLMLTIETVLL